jgi:hypothetical protein
MKPLSLIYTTSCQNYKPTKQIFKELGLAFMKINQHHLREESSFKHFSSPTLLVDNDIIIFGKEVGSSEGTCTVNLPDKEELRNIINGLT